MIEVRHAPVGSTVMLNGTKWVVKEHEPDISILHCHNCKLGLRIEPLFPVEEYQSKRKPKW